MRGFKTTSVREVILTRQAEEGEVKLSFFLQALPLGYHELLAAVYPVKVTEYVNGKPVTSPADQAAHDAMVGYLLLAKSLRDADPAQIETPEPGVGATRDAWHAYALAVQAEFVAANLVVGDIQALAKGLQLANLGAGRPKKGAGA